MLRPLLWTCFWGLMACLCHAQDTRTAALRRFEAFVHQETANGDFSGVILVAEGNKVLLHQAFGMADFRRDVPMDTSHQFMIASLSKAFTAAAVLKLVEEGKLSLDDPLGMHLPEARGRLEGDATLQQLLTHSAGLADFINDHLVLFQVRSFLRWRPSRERLLRAILTDPYRPSAEEETHYSNSGYVLLGQVVENASGMSYDEYVRTHLLQPLGMRQSGVGDVRQGSRLARGFGGTSYVKRATQNMPESLTLGMGGVYSTSGDLFRWMRALMDTVVLTPESRQAMFTAQAQEYGMGWMVEPFEDSLIYHHSGYFPGWTSYICHLPAQGISFICLSNYSQTDPWYIRDEFLHLWETNQREPLHPARQPLLKAQAQEGIIPLQSQGAGEE